MKYLLTFLLTPLNIRLNYAIKSAFFFKSRRQLPTSATQQKSFSNFLNSLFENWAGQMSAGQTGPKIGSPKFLDNPTNHLQAVPTMELPF